MHALCLGTDRRLIDSYHHGTTKLIIIFILIEGDGMILVLKYWFQSVCQLYFHCHLCDDITNIDTNVFINLPRLLIVNAGSDRHLKPQQIIPVSTDAEMALNTPNCTISDLSCNSAGYLCLETSSSHLLLLSMGI